jgi:hypothetical protein
VLRFAAYHRKKKKTTVQPGNAFEDPAFKPVLEIVKF